MSVITPKIQTVEERYRRIGTAIVNQPTGAIYKERPRLFCPHRLGLNRLAQPRLLCYQDGGESESGWGPIGVAGELALHRFRETAPRGTVGGDSPAGRAIGGTPPA